MRPLIAALAVLVAAALPAPPSAEAAGFPEPLSGLRARPDTSERGGRIIDTQRREVLLRGVNVNSLVEYWQGNVFPTTLPLRGEDLRTMRSAGWNAVRLLLSWSRIEPRPGEYDAGYLNQALAYVDAFAKVGIYSVIDLHQDRWGPHVAARPGEECPPGRNPAMGWDGAPEWATLVPPEIVRCNRGIARSSPAVSAAFDAFWRDAPGPGGVGIRRRYIAMLKQVAMTFGPRDSVAGYDVMNEPGAPPRHEAALDDLYTQAVLSLREGEAAVGAPPRLVLVQPAVPRWKPASGPPLVPPDRNVAYAPHLYAGGLSVDRDLDVKTFTEARDEALDLGGAPVIVGEWGTNPNFAQQGYFDAHLDHQDSFGFSSMLWTWSQSCGDPHKVAKDRAAAVTAMWGVLDVDCRTNTVKGVRRPLLRDLTRPYVRATPGRLGGQRSDASGRRFRAWGRVARSNRTRLVAFLPSGPRVRSRGLRGVTLTALPGGGRILRAVPRGRWVLETSR